MGDERTYENVIALRVVDSTDAMTADWTRLPHDFLARLANRLINEVKGVNRVVYDISSKPAQHHRVGIGWVGFRFAVVSSELRVFIFEKKLGFSCFTVMAIS